MTSRRRSTPCSCRSCGSTGDLHRALVQRPIVQLGRLVLDVVEAPAVEDAALAADVVGAQEQDAVEADLAGAPLAVPRPAAEVHPDATPVGLLLRVPVVVLAGEHEAHEQVPITAHDQDRPVLAL